MKKPLGVILYQGPSVLDGKPIVVLASFNTKNDKTGNMIQTWIMRDDMSPITARNVGADESVCGRCPHRHAVGGGCYVVLMHGPLKVYNAYKEGRYVPIDQYGYNAVFIGKRVRIGSYGDPAAVPFNIWDYVCKYADDHTGYTHQIGHPNFDSRILRFCMVSTETEPATAAHNRHGRRTFRVKSPDQPLRDGEVLCPADPNKGISCLTCMACNPSKNGPSVAVDAHGVMKKRVINKFGTRIL